jgi:serine/threonine protein kinase
VWTIAYCTNSTVGIVGSDPYLAPEVYDEQKYDPAAVDVWSLAIIFCCMTLRRFPWKVPRMTDSSFKLFAADPTPGHDPKRLILPPSRSATALDHTPERAFDPHSDAGGHSHSHKAHRDETEKNDEKMPNSTPKDSVSSPQTENHPPPEKKEVVKGPWRILRLLPRETRHVIGRMLEIDPKKRIKMEEILEDPWVANTVICRQIDPGLVVNAEDHTHVLEPPASASK